MTINYNIGFFAGLPVVDLEPPDVDDRQYQGKREQQGLADPAAVAWRIDMEDFDAPPEDLEAALDRVLEYCGPAGPTALVIGQWGSAYEAAFPVEMLVGRAARLSGLRGLFVGDMSTEQCEVSWIKQGDYTPLLEAFPALEHLWIRGSDGLELTPVRHEGLRGLVLQTGGLPATVIRAVSACDLPGLTHLELWLGVRNYGGDARADDLAPILAGRSLSALTHLGLRNAEIADEVATAVAAAPVVARIAELDLSLGVLSDAGAEALLAGQPLTHLKKLDLHHHFLTPEMATRVVEELPGVAVDISERQDERRWGRYTAVSE